MVTAPGEPPVAAPPGPFGTRGLHPQGIVLRREHRDAQRRAEEGREAARQGPLSRRTTSRPRTSWRWSTPASSRRRSSTTPAPRFWKQVFTKLTLNRGAAVRTGGQIGWMIRKNSPQLKKALDAFLARYPEGSATRNQLLAKYLKSTKYAKSATSSEERAKFNNVLALFRKYCDRVRHGHAPDGRPGLPGVAPRPDRQEPRRRDRRDAGDAGDRQGAEGRRHPPDRPQHPRRGQVRPLHARQVLRQRADGRRSTRGSSRSRPTTPGPDGSRSSAGSRRSAASIPTSGSTTSSSSRPRRSAARP